MGLSDWVWSSIIGAGGMAFLFAMMYAGSRKKGRIGQVLNVVGFVVGGSLIYIALNDDLLRQLLDFFA